ncbi:MAG: hypothetical protein AUJ92_14420 [Armatimonadetes bacterium CG2_30_59_28]|nr:rhomboid family intramembrane serine protease [Armatimonadota bacterium]OIO92410.1 MAG: hypothetical protein AUJ92_14420 [Armatimonadetes bacterium CG2_30_59_28]PIU63687.1 MAG: hypothetical protein COS85_15390 [Armatimonadetes bacterium CG07_land_8_20_14_0_80_59_28]PIY38650.1 MAG: hypothetical protein COZ05_20435 [Armatimonadetes bacterium CG_4_10_14_3_um_filter_59_10]PJB69706.1 MAG: hypothetical protein CO095_09660 [Armatimonadetes bacterium CG_4_9_14_3_um_filter_58_7]
MFFFIPYGTDRPARSFPFITYTLIAINVIVFAWQYGVSNSDAVMDRYAFIPNQLNGMSWFTYMFLHGGLSHLAGNMLYLWLFGCALECALGWWIFLPTYLLSGCVAMMLHYSIVMATDPVGANTHLVGASGAIAGLLGMYALRFYQTRIRMWYFVFLLFFIRWGKFEIGSVWFIAIWIAQQIFGAAMSAWSPDVGSHIAYWTHIGGFGLGMLYALLINLQSEGKSEYVLADAVYALDRQDYRRALQLSGEVVKREPANSEARLVHVRSGMHTRPFEDFIPEYESLMKDSLQKHNLELAQALYTELESLYPTNGMDSRLRLAIATCLAQLGDHAGAVRVLQRIIQEAPNSAEAETATLRYAQLLIEQLGRPKEAADALRHFVVRYPNSQWKDFAEQLLAKARQAMRK